MFTSVNKLEQRHARAPDSRLGGNDSPDTLPEPKARDSGPNSYRRVVPPVRGRALGEPVGENVRGGLLGVRC